MHSSCIENFLLKIYLFKGLFRPGSKQNSHKDDVIAKEKKGNTPIHIFILKYLYFFSQQNRTETP